MDPAKIKRHRRQALWLGVPGYCLYVAGYALALGLSCPVFLSLTAVGFLMYWLGCRCYALSKGRHPAWGMLAFLDIMGLIFLTELSDRSKASPA